MQLNYTTAQTELEVPSILDKPEGKAQLCFYILTFILGSVGNVLVLLVVRGKKNKTVNDLFIVNLAISDLLMISFFPLYSVYILVRFRLSTSFCKSIWPLSTMTFFVSVFTLTSMAIHRCYVITNPFKPEMRKWRILVWLVGLWVASFLAVIPVVLVHEADSTGTCIENWPSFSLRKTYTASLFVLQYSLPLTIITAAYIRIAMDLLTSKTQRFGPGSNNNRREGHRLLSMARKEDIQVLKTVAVIVVVFAVCLLPLQLAWMLTDFGGEKEKKIAQKVFFKFDVLLSTFHSCVNPLVYGTLTRRFRVGYIRYLVYLCPCLKQHIAVPVNESTRGNSLMAHKPLAVKKENSSVPTADSHDETLPLSNFSPYVRTTNV